MFHEGGGWHRKKKIAEAELDITPMIDVTFLLLIFFMVTSTMQGTPDKDIPPAQTGDNANAASFLEVTVLAPKTPGGDSEILVDGRTTTLDELQNELMQRAPLAPPDVGLKLMIYAERDVRSGFIGEVEGVINEVDEGKITYSFAVRDKK
ncbi:MAG: biopolymer transporter ExbD [Planctomycetaceae bacterium]